MQYKVGSKLRVRNHEGVVRGFIEYRNPKDNNKTWREYRVIGNQGEWWLSIDDEYKEYSISWPANDVKGNIGPEWNKVDEGTQVVKNYSGDVDVDLGEQATFVEYEDETKDKILSVEIWADGTEYSRGEYIEESEIELLGMETIPNVGKKYPGLAKAIIAIIVIIVVIPILMDVVGNLIPSNSSISTFLSGSEDFAYETSITGSSTESDTEKADVYAYLDDGTGEAITDDVAKLIINGIDGNTESVTQQDEQTNGDIAIVTDKEYCLVYHPEDNAQQILVQVSDRKYNYTSAQAPYRSSIASTNWYRSHYYSSAFTADSSTFSSSPSAYSMYSGDTVHNIGNGYFDTYSRSVKQSSTASRSSSGGGLSSGK